MAKKKRTPQPSPPAPEPGSAALESLRQLEGELTKLQEPVVRRLQAALDSFAKGSFGSLEANQAVVTAIQRLLRPLGLSAQCPRCGKPAILRCRATQNAKSGSFQFEHSERGQQTNHGGSTAFPAFRLMPPAPDHRREKKRRKQPRRAS
jgi:hypothetical protein